MEYLLVVFAVWFLWNVLLSLVSSQEWMQYLFIIALSIGGALLIEPSTWWYGVGLAGVASLLMLASDLLLVATDWIRTQVLRNR